MSDEQYGCSTCTVAITYIFTVCAFFGKVDRIGGIGLFVKSRIHYGRSVNDKYIYSAYACTCLWIVQDETYILRHMQGAVLC